MKYHNRKSIMILLLIFTAFLAGCVDQSRASIETELNKEERIISTSIVICEILDVMEIESVVGIPQSETFIIPKRYEDAVTVGMPMAPDMEIISALEPTWVLSPQSLEGSLSNKFEAAHVNSYFADLLSVEGMYESIKELGALFDKEYEAEALIKEYGAFMEEYKKDNSTNSAPTVLILMGLPGSYVVATNQSYVGSLVQLAGGHNVYEEEQMESFLNINAEDMLERDPDLILLASHALPEQVEDMFEEEFANNDIWKHFRAVQEEMVYTLDYQRFGMSANFKYREALDDLANIFYY